MKQFFFLILFLLFAGCGTTLTGYKYKTHAVYQAPRSKFKLTVDSEGRVAAGADISDTYNGTATIEPISPDGKIVLLIFQDDDAVSYKIDSGENQKGKWGFRDSLDTLKEILGKAGYTEMDDDEIRESIRAIGGVFSGPKGVILKGQSKHITVLE